MSDLTADDLRVPKAARKDFDAVVDLTDEYCRHRGDMELATQCRKMVGALARKRPPPISRGGKGAWAAGVMTCLARVNFLFDRHAEGAMSANDVASAFGVSKSTAANKARTIEQALKIGVFDVKWTLPSLLARNPRAWLVQFQGLLIDARALPVELQRLLYLQGRIPYVPGE